MELRTVADFPRILDRFAAWWGNDLLDRPVVTLPPHYAVRPTPPPSQHASLRDRWMDVEFAMRRVEASLAGVQYLADSFPRYYANLGPDVVATLFGSQLEFREQTSWSAPIAKNCREILSLQPDFDNEYWRTIKRMTAESIARSNGRWITGLTDLHTNCDLLASLRGSESLCVELVDDAQAVEQAARHVTAFYSRIYEDLYAPVAAAGLPTITWSEPLYHGRMYVTSCDFICMVSPAMFQRFVLPSLLEEMRWLDANMFHLDGPGALVHLDALLSLPEMTALQWVYGAGSGPSTRWVDVYRRAQAAGKPIQVLVASFDEALELTEHLQPRGVWFGVSRGYSPQATEQFLARMRRWASGGRA